MGAGNLWLAKAGPPAAPYGSIFPNVTCSTDRHSGGSFNMWMNREEGFTFVRHWGTFGDMLELSKSRELVSC